MKNKILPFLFIYFLFFSCSTIKFGQIKNFYLPEEKTPGVRELDLSYSYKVMGINVKGTKSIVEEIFVHPDNKTLFLCISFPKIGILRTDDKGKTYQTHFIKLSYLDKIFGYENRDTEETEGNDKKEIEKPARHFYHFAVSKTNPDHIVITIGSYIFTTKNMGNSWDVKNLFFDVENTKIKDVFITGNNEIVVMTDKKLAYSPDWGKTWKKRAIKLNSEKFYKFSYTSGCYDNTSRLLYASFKHNDESNADLSAHTYDYFYQNKQGAFKSGLYYSPDLGVTWIKSPVTIPVVLWTYNDAVYAGPVYPLSLYKKVFSDNFMNSPIYRDANLDVSPYGIRELTKIILDMNIEDYHILSKTNNMIAKIHMGESQDIELFEETDFLNLYTGIQKLHSVEQVQWKELWYEEKKSTNFFYEFNPHKLFKLWTGMRTNCPVLYKKDDTTLYRLKPHPEFLKVFITYSIEKQVELNTTKPFFRKKTDIEFFDPELDPTGGFPVVIEYSNDMGETWKELYTTEFIRNIINPLNNKRSGFYWYKNVDQKKILKLQVSFGFDEGANYLVYPHNLTAVDNELIMHINYFTIGNSYKDTYLIPSIMSE